MMQQKQLWKNEIYPFSQGCFFVCIFCILSIFSF